MTEVLHVRISGYTINMPAEHAMELIRAGVAERVEPESAQVAPVERAVRRRPVARPR